jgi:c-di-GMP-binding flagellar brake protein YcgR
MRPEDTDIYSQYLLHSSTEIAFVLRDIMQRGCMLTAYFDEGDFFFLTSLLNVTPEGIVLDYGGDEAVNQRALRTGRLVCITSVDRVKVQFALNGLSLTQFDGRHAFSSAMPYTLLRLQRREFFRIGTPVVNPVKCEIPFSKPDGSGTTLQVRLIDISVGGIGLMLSTEQLHFFEPERLLENCLLDLPNESQISMTLRVRNAFEVENRSGSRYTRVGCEYCDLRTTALNIIQRYITQLERERKARLSGLE